jgi:hypothetical protein
MSYWHEKPAIKPVAKKMKFQRKNEQMNFENFTIKAQESVQKALTIAGGRLVMINV